ncbi:hypothetical protein D3C72_1511210 [compost metagenome]
MRVEQGEGQAGQQHLPPAATTTGIGRGQRAATAPCAQPGLQAIAQQEGGAAEAQHLQQQRPLQHQRSHAANAGQDQRDVRAHAGHHHHAHVATLQPLPQHEGVLRADGDDQASTRKQAGQGRSNPHPTLSTLKGGAGCDQLTR